MSGPSSELALVTGATGFTGRALALELVRRGYRVRGLVRSQEGAEDLLEAGVELSEGDIRDADYVMRSAEGVDRIFHIAAVFRTAGHPDEYYQAVNAEAVRHVVEAARRWSVERTVHCSTIGVHGDVGTEAVDEDAPFRPGDIYQETKLEGELIARAAFDAGLPGVVFRPTGIFGPGDLRFLKLFRAVHSGRFRMIGSGRVRYHLIYIDDLVDGIILCGEHPAALGETYIMAGEEHTTLNEFVDLIASAVGVEPPRGHIPVWPVMAAAVACEAVCRPLGIDPPLHRRRVAFFTKNRIFSIEKARRELGFRPSVPFKEAILRTARWYFEQGHLGGEMPRHLERVR